MDYKSDTVKDSMSLSGKIKCAIKEVTYNYK